MEANPSRQAAAGAGVSNDAENRPKNRFDCSRRRLRTHLSVGINATPNTPREALRKTRRQAVCSHCRRDCMSNMIRYTAGLLGAAALLRTPLSAEPPVKGLVAHWTFDEAAGSPIKDLSGKGNDGVLRGAARVPGKTGNAIKCGQDELVEVPHSEALDAFGEGITVSAWINREADPTWNMIISREVKDGPSEYFGLAVVKNKALFSVDPDGAHYQNIKGEPDVASGKWVHLAGTYDNRTFNLYVDGQLARSAPCSIPFRFQDKNPLILGGNTNTEGKKWVDCFHGRIDEVQLFNRALSAVEIAQLAQPLQRDQTP